MQDADGHTVLSYRHAQEAAREWWKGEESRAQDLEPAERVSYFVRDAVSDYLVARHRRGSRGVPSDRSYAEARILPELGGIELSRLTTARIRHWHTDLAIKPKFVRTKAGATARAVRPVDLDDPEAVRARWSSANRVLTVLKAALNYAFQEGRVLSDQAWRRVKPFCEADAPRVRFLREREISKFLRACPIHEFRDLASGGLAKGVVRGIDTTSRR